MAAIADPSDIFVLNKARDLQHLTLGHCVQYLLVHPHLYQGAHLINNVLKAVGSVKASTEHWLQCLETLASEADLVELVVRDIKVLAAGAITHSIHTGRHRRHRYAKKLLHTPLDNNDRVDGVESPWQWFRMERSGFEAYGNEAIRDAVALFATEVRAQMALEESSALPKRKMLIVHTRRGPMGY